MRIVETYGARGYLLYSDIMLKHSAYGQHTYANNVDQYFANNTDN